MFVKFCIVVVLMILCASAEWQAAASPTERNLDHNEYEFVYSIVNSKSWCITATDGMHIGAQVTSRLCSFDDYPSNQMWRFEGGKFKSKRDPDKCLKVGSRSGGRVRLAPCSSNDDLMFFQWDGDKIYVSDDVSYCLTNQGSTPEVGDYLVAVKCGKRDKFMFEIGEERFNSPSGTFGLNNDDSYPESGCLVVEDEDPKAGQQVILGHCQQNHNWRYDIKGRFHTTLDDSMCLQAGTKDNENDPARAGWRVRVFPCSSTKKQIFDYDWVDIRLREIDFLCVGFSGTTSEVNKDPIILKPCGRNGDNWSQD